MERKRIVVFDYENQYVVRLVEFLRENLFQSEERNYFDIYGFSVEENLLEFLKGKEVEILLLPFSELLEELPKFCIAHIVLLSDGEHIAENSTYPSIYKYQRGDEILRELMDYYAEVSIEVNYKLDKKTECIAVYSPIGRCGKTTFAMALGEELGKKCRVLYIGMEEYSGFEELLGRQFTNNLSDLLYFYNKDHVNFSAKIKAVVQRMGHFDYIPPVSYEMELIELETYEWRTFFQKMMQQGHYDVFILDLGNRMKSTMGILEQCHKLFVPIQNDRVSQAKLKEFLEKLKLDYPKLEERIQQIQVPDIITENKKSYEEMIVRGELSEYVRGVYGAGEETKRDFTGATT